MLDVKVETRYGAVRGRVVDRVNVFKGVPYAAPPFGPNRLLPPRPVEPWCGVRDALEFGPKAPQTEYPQFVSMILPELTETGEDCLTVNVWTPELAPARLPVMVWIPGGLFEYHGTGAAPWYDGARFARDGVVCVTANYRVGAEGFLDLGGGNANRGLLDQIAALEWVRDQIAAFGGNPGNVTVFGESAGAMSVATLLAVPRAGGLFRRAVAQSGAAQAVSSAATGRRIAEYIAGRLGVDATRETIAALPPDRLLAAQATLRADLMAEPDPNRWGAEVVAGMLPWQPVVDGEVLPAPPLERIAAGAGGTVDLIVGTNTEESRISLVPGGAIDHVTPEAVAGAIAGFGLPVAPTLAAYRAAHPGATAGDLLAAVITDGYWRLPAARLADAHAPGPAATYMYEFGWRSPQFGGRLGACHAMEVAFVFDTLGRGTAGLMGDAPPQALADVMHGAWVSFATSGDPGWPRYDLDRRATMHFDTATVAVDDPLAAVRALWSGVGAR